MKMEAILYFETSDNYLLIDSAVIISYLATNQFVLQYRKDLQVTLQL